MPFVKYSLLIFCILTLLGKPAAAQYYFRHYQTDDGLAHNRVNVIFQDSRGLMWIGTRDGLNRFDGYNFKACRNLKSKFGNIGDNNIIAITENQDGMLWVGTSLGLFRYNPFKEEFKELKGAPRSRTGPILTGRRNEVWFISGNSICCYNEVNGKLTDTGVKGSAMVFDEQMNLWVGDHSGVIKVYNRQLQLLSSFPVLDQGISANARSISKLYIQGDKLLIGCFEQGLKMYHRATGKIESLIAAGQNGFGVYVRDIAAEHGDKFWIATETGIYVYNLKTRQATLLDHRADDPYSMSATATYTVCRDRDGGMWAGTYFGGINYYSARNAVFEKYYPKANSNAMSGMSVREICADQSGNLWIGTEDAGLNKLDLKSGVFTHFAPGHQKTALSYPNVHGVLPVGPKLYVSTFFHGLDVLDIPSGRVTEKYPVLDPAEPRMTNFIFRIYQTKDGTLLMGTKGAGSGLFNFNQQTKQFRRIPEIPRNSMVNDIMEDSGGNIWTASSTQGVYLYHPKTGFHKNIRFSSPADAKSDVEFAVYGLFEDSERYLWFATEGGGLIRLSPDHQSIKRYTTADGLPSNILYRVLEDNAKRLWISTSKGLVCFNKRTGKMVVYTTDNGLLTDQLNYNSAFKDGHGKMYFGSVKGMVAFYPELLGKAEPAPPIYLTGLQINNQEVVPGGKNSPLKKSMLYTDTLALSYNQNTLSVEFAALNYISAKTTKYKYLMTGLTRNWTYLEKNRKVYFTDLAPGQYVLRVQARSSLGTWEGKERRLIILISPPFWKSNMAYLLYTCLGATGLYLAFHLYHQNQVRKSLNKQRLFEHQKEKELYQAKIEFFTNIAHEIKSPLTLILGPIEWVLKKVSRQPFVTRNLLMVQESAERLMELANQLLDFRKTEIDQFGLSFVNADVSKLVVEQFGLYQFEIEKTGLAATIKVPDEPVLAFVDREVFTKIFTNLLSNAVKYAATQLAVELMVASEGDWFLIRLMNDGKGIPEELKERIFEPFFRLRQSSSKPGTGIGLALARSLTELHNGTLTLLSGANNAIVFELKLPVHQQVEFELKDWKNIGKV